MVKNLSVATGKRKTSVARVFLRDGSGAITVNGKPMEQYFAGLETASSVRAPLDVTNNTGKFDVLISVRGGGPSGQIEACRHGIARALTAHDETNRPALRANGYLTRDSRMVERKKYGQAGARRRFQFSTR
ncbi:MAG: 30S ribosomal protein S9 [Spirochaetes bacterium]|nr:30S ribosomal protein S9 [Spirochaetota bacterium]